MKKLMILPLLATIALADYTQYKPSEDFAKYFTKQSCSQNFIIKKFKKGLKQNKKQDLINKTRLEFALLAEITLKA